MANLPNQNSTAFSPASSTNGVYGRVLGSKSQIDTLLNKFLENLRQNGSSQSTVNNYASDIGQYLAFANVSDPKSLANEQLIAGFFADQEKKGLKSSTIQRKIISLRQFFDWLDRELTKSFPPTTPPTPQTVPAFIPSPTATPTAMPTRPQPVSQAQVTTRPITPEISSPKSGNKTNWFSLIFTVIGLTSLVILLSYLGYRQLTFSQAETRISESKVSLKGRTLAISGKLSDSQVDPIQSSTQAEFRIYDGQDNGIPLWTSETCLIQPDAAGEFSVLLGENCGEIISENIFTNHDDLWLELIIGGEKLDPRIPLSSMIAESLDPDSLSSSDEHTTTTPDEEDQKTSSNQTNNSSVVSSLSQIINNLIRNGYLFAPGATISSTYNQNIPVTINGTGGKVFSIDNSGTTFINGQIDANGGGTHDIAGTLNLSGNILSSSENLIINSGGGQIIFADGDVLNIGGATAQAYNFLANSTSGNNLASDDNDLYIEGYLEVDNHARFEGDLTLTSLNTAGGIIYANSAGRLQVTDQGTNGQCLVSAGSGTPTWGTCGAAGDSAWNISDGSYTPVNTTLDLLLGSTATSSAEFAVININSGTPTASISAVSTGTGLSLGGDGVIQTTRNNDLTIGGNTTGNIILSPLNGSGALTANLGSGQLFNLLTGNLKVGNGTPDVSLNGEDAYIEGTFEVDGTSRFDGNTTFNGTVTASTLNTAGGIIYANSSGQLLVSAQGTGGQCLQSGGSGAPTWGSCGSGSGTSYWDITDGSLAPVNATLDILVGATATDSAKFAVINVNSGTPTASLSAGAAGGAYLTATGTLQTTADQDFTLGGATTGNITLSPLNGSGALTANIGASQLFNILTGNLKVGNGTPDVSQNGEDGYIEGTLEVDGATRLDDDLAINGGDLTSTQTTFNLLNSTVTTLNLAGAGTTLNIGAGGALTRTFNIGTGTGADTINIGTGGTAADDINLGGLATSTIDILGVTTLGDGGSTNYASFNATGDLTFTGSADTITGPGAGGLSITNAAGAIALSTTTSGDITLTNGATGGLVNILTGNLKVGNGSPDVTLGGEDAYIEGTLEVDGTSRFDGNSTFNGTLTVSALNTAGGIIYANSSGQLLVSAQGSSGQCLISGAAGAPTWDTCDPGGGGGSFWAISTGAIAPVNSTVDLLVGATATDSAKFAVINVNSGTPTASLSAGSAGGAYLTAAGTLQTTANQDFTLGGDTTGNITLSPLNGSGALTANIGAAQLFNVLTGNFKVGNGTPDVSQNGEDGYIEGTLEVDGATRLDDDLAVNGGDITSTQTTFNLLNSTVTTLNLAGAGTTLNIGAGGALTRTFNIATGTGADTINIGTGGSTADDINLGGLATSTIDILGVTTLGDGGSTNYASFNATGDLTFTGSADTITGPGAGGLNITNASGAIALSTTTSGDITLTNGATGGLVNILTGNLKVGNGSPDVTLGGEDAYIEGTFEVDGAARFDGTLTASTLNTAGGIIYANSSGQLLVSAQGSSGQCLLSGGTGAPTWSACDTNELWDITSGAIHPENTTVDLLVGATATSSAKFAVINVNSGTPTASLSAGAAGGAYLTATGTLQTTANQDFTLGGDSTGNITLSPLNGSGSLTANIGATQLFNVLTGNLKVGNGTPDVTQDGEDAYIEGTLEVDGATRLDDDLAVNGGDLTSTQTTFNLLNSTVTTLNLAGAGTTLNIGAGGALTRTFNIGTGTGADTINIGTGGTTADDINLGGLATSTIDILGVTTLGDGGSTNYASFNATGDLTFTGSADTITGPGAGGLNITNASGAIALSTTTSGDITLTNGAAGGLVNILTGNLKVGNGSPDVTLSGEDAYIEGTFEVDGAARFDGSLTASTLNTAGGIIYANSSGQLLVSAQGSTGECLVSGGSGTPTWTSCSGAGSYWELNQGTIAPVNDTLDFLIGANATDSAKFAVINVNSGTPTASLSAGAAGGAYLTATGTLQTTANQDFTLGGDSTGNITLSPLNGSGSLTANIGATQLFNVLTGNLKVGNGTPDVTQDGEDAYIEGTLEVDGTSRFDSNVTASADLAVNGGDLTSTQTTFNLLNDTVTTLNLAGAGTTLNIGAGGALTRTFNIGTGTGADTINIGTGASTADDINLGGLATSTIDILGVTTLGDGGSTNYASFNATGDLTFTGSADTITGPGAGGLNITNAAGAIALSTTTSGDITLTNGAAGGLVNILTGNLKVGNGSPDVTLGGEDAYIEGTLEVDGAARFDGTLTASTLNTAGGIIYANSSGQLLVSAQGSSGQCLISGAAGAPTWDTCDPGGGGGSFWAITDGAIAPVNSTVDLLVGATATDSAKFAVINVNSGTPTASLSAGAAGGAYLTAAGTLQTTANQDFTLGGDTTGNITLSPLNGSGALTANIGATQLFNVLTGNLKVGNGSPDVTLGGEDAYIEGTLEVDGDTRLDGDLAVNGGDITSTQTTFNLLNSTVTTLNMAGAATTLNIGAGGALTRTFNIGTGTGADTINIGTGGTAADDINLGGLATSTIDILGVTTLGDGGSTNYASFNATGDLTFTGSADTITGPGAGGLNITNAAGAIALSTTTSGDITQTTGAATGLVNVLTGNLKVGNGTPDVTQDGEDAYIEGTLEVDGDTRLDGDLTVNGGDILGPSGENIDLGEATADTITFTIGSTAELLLNSTNLNPNAAEGLALGGTSNEWEALYLGDNNGVFFGLDQDWSFGYDELNDDRLELVTTGTSGMLISSATVSGTGLLQSFDSVTTGTGSSLSVDALTTGTGLSVQSTSTALSTGTLANFEWAPTGSTEIFATGNLFNINLGQYGNIGNIFNVQDNGSDIFSVGQSLITSALPHEFTAAGDVSIAYDLVFTNQTTSNIKSYGPLTIESGESFENNNLTFKTWGTGDFIFENDGSTVASINDGGGIIANNAFVSNFTVPLYRLYETDGGTDQKYTELYANSGSFVARFMNDAYTNASNIMIAERNGGTYTVANVQFPTGNVGINDATPTEAKLVVGGDIYALTFTSSGTAALCWDNSGGSTINDCSGTPVVDYAEIFPTEKNVDFAEIVAIGPNTAETDFVSTDKEGNLLNAEKKHISVLERATAAKRNLILGITSRNWSDFSSTGHGSVKDSDHPMPVALAGRVPVKVSSSSSAILMGDPITVSNEPGKASKATSAGQIIGQALESWSPGSGKETVLVFVSPGYHDPNIQLAENGDLKTNYQLDTETFAVREISTGVNVSKVLALAEAMIGKITAGFIQTTELIADRVTVREKLVSPVIETQTLKTDLIVPHSGDIKFDLPTATQSVKVRNNQGQTVASIDAQGNASFSGQLSAATVSAQTASFSGEITAQSARYSRLQSQLAKLDSLEVSNATISGDLTLADGSSLKQLLSDNQAYIASLSAENSNLNTQISTHPQSVSADSFNQFLTQLTGSEDASISAALAALQSEQDITLTEEDVVLAPTAAFIKEFLSVGGYTQLTTADVSNSLTIGNSLLLTPDAIATAGETLFIQPVETGRIDFLNGKFVLNSQGIAELQGDLFISGKLDVGEKLSTNLVSPLDYSSDFNLKLATQSAILGETTQSKFQVLDASNSAVASIDASGSARFRSLAARGIVIEQPTADSSHSADASELAKQQTAGHITLPAGATELTIENDNVTDSSLIYLTPTSNTQNQVVFVKAKDTCSGPFTLSSCQQSFTIGINQAVSTAINLNYWIIETR